MEKHMGQVKYDMGKGSFQSLYDVRALRGAESPALQNQLKCRKILNGINQELRVDIKHDCTGSVCLTQR